MDFKGKYSIPAAPDQVWAALHEPATLSACIPGCESVAQVSPNEYKAVATLKVGPVKARFQGKVVIDELIPPPGFAHAMRLSGEGQGGAAGFARGQSEVHLAAEGSQTALEYTAKAMVGGKLAQIGQRLIDGAAKSVADEFFVRLSVLIQTKAAAAVAAPAPAPAPATQARPAQVPKPPGSEGLAPQVWVAGLIGIIVILLIFFSIVL